MKLYQYGKHCPDCDNGRQLGQTKACPIHHKSLSKFTMRIILEVKPTFVDPAMS